MSLVQIRVIESNPFNDSLCSDLAENPFPEVGEMSLMNRCVRKYVDAQAGQTPHGILPFTSCCPSATSGHWTVSTKSCLLDGHAGVPGVLAALGVLGITDEDRQMEGGRRAVEALGQVCVGGYVGCSCTGHRHL